MVNLQTAINVTLWVLFALASVAMGLRLTTRAKRVHKVFLDDWVMLFSWALNLASCICSSIAVNAGIGKHLTELVPGDIPNAIFWGLVATNVGLLADTFPKLAVALLVNRLLAQRRSMNYFTLGISTILILISIILFIMGFEQCQPVAHQWNRMGVPGTCWDPLIFTNFAIFAGTYSAAIDLFFSLYPPVVIFRLNMALKKKLTVMAMLSLGLFTFAVTSYKTIDQLPTLAHEDVDATWVIGQVMLWGIVESSVTVIAGSIPTWDWLLQTDRFERLVEWITLHSLRSSRSRELRDSSENLAQADKTSAGKRSGSNGGSDEQDPNLNIHLDSVTGLERSAYS